MTIGHVNFSWRRLNDALNNMIDAINANQPLEGQGTSLDKQGSAGTAVHASPAQPPSGAATQDTGGGSSLQPTLLNSLVLHGLTFQNVTVVNPATCQSSTISVLVNTGIDTDTITLNCSGYQLWATMTAT